MKIRRPNSKLNGWSTAIIKYYTDYTVILQIKCYF